MTSLMLSLALAEGTSTLGTTQALRSQTVLAVDVLQPGEVVTWVGSGALRVTGPDGVAYADLASGGSFAAEQTGSWTFVSTVDQPLGSAWSLGVEGELGRLWSRSWRFNAGSFSSTAATNASFYAKVPGGAPGTTAVIELELQGLAGYIYDINANRIGVDGAGSLSTPQAGNTVTAEFPIYLNPPADATYLAIEPTVQGLVFEGGQGGASVLDGSEVTCDTLASGGSPGRFRFSTDAEGTGHLRCDLDGDGRLGGAGTPDISIPVVAGPGSNEIIWDGLDRYGNAVQPGTYACRVELRTGEFHYVGADIETSYPGLRLYEVAAEGTRTPLPMYWDDTLVQSQAVVMPNGEVGAVSADGLLSGTYGQTAVPNVDARSWGEFAGTGKGNLSFLDTSTWLESGASTFLQVSMIDALVDSDNDGLSDHEETCIYGTDADLADSDGDGVLDGDQYGQGASSGNDGGLESNGTFSQALAFRHVQRTRYGTSPALERGRSSVSPLAAWLPEAPVGTTAVVTSPYDLVGTTEAVDVVAQDYQRGGRTLAAVLIIETTGQHYSHTKAICDRAAGKSLTDLVVSPGGTHLTATLVGRDGGRDHAGSWVAIEGEDGWTLHSAWLVDQLPAVAPGQRVLQIQAWSSTPGLVDSLLAGVGERLHGTWTEHAPVRVPPHLRAASSWGNTLTVDGPEGWRVVGTLEDGQPFEREAGAALPPFLEASILLEADGDLVDRAWVSDGTWIRMDGPMEDCAPRTDRPEGVALSGCGATSTGTVLRTLRPPRALSGSIAIHASVAGEVCVESAAAAAFTCAPLEAGWNRVPFERFSGDPRALASADVLGFHTDHGTLEVAGLTLSAFGEDAEASQCGCDASASPGWFAVWLLPLLLRRRRA